MKTYNREEVKRIVISKKSVEEIYDVIPTAELSIREYNALKLREGLLISIGPYQVLLTYEGRDI